MGQKGKALIPAKKDSPGIRLANLSLGEGGRDTDTLMRKYMVVSCLLLLFCGWPSVGLTADLEKITSHPAVDYYASPSPDGRYVGFVSERSGNPDIWMKSLAVGAASLPRQLTTHPAVDRDPALNPDGGKLLYVSHKTDPRGDIFLMDVVTGEEQKLTDLTSGDSAPRWGRDEETIYYLKHNLVTGIQSVVQREMGSGVEHTVIPEAATFSLTKNGGVIFSKNGSLQVMPSAGAAPPIVLTSDQYLDVWPVIGEQAPSGEGQMIYFTRYEKDTNQDGIIDFDDESSLWSGVWNEQASTFQDLYRLTPSHEFYLFPSAAKGSVYFSDLKRGDIYRFSYDQFLKDYVSFETAQSLATLYRDKGDIERELVVLANISRNLVSTLSEEQRAQFDFDYVESLMAVGNYEVARDVLSPYQHKEGTIQALANLQSIVLEVHTQRELVSDVALQHMVENSTQALLEIGEQYQDEDRVLGQAFIDAGRLHLLTGDFLTALEYLVKVDELNDQEVRAKALFSRAQVYQRLGDDGNLLQVYVDVIMMFGEQSSWGRRAIRQAITVSEQGNDVHQQVASLRKLIDQYPNFPLLSASTRYRMAELYQEQGEQMKAIEVLDQIIDAPPPFPALLEDSYRRKAHILSSSEKFEEAAKIYELLGTFTGVDQGEVEGTQKLMVRQLVKKALKDRAIGELRIAAKAFKQITQDYPWSVEAHRGYIETKVMLKETPEVQAWYQQKTEANPQDPVLVYAYALATSYSEPPDFPKIIDLVREAIRMNPGISYFHQTLGWAYEQEERIGGKKGFFEKAESEYRLALEQNDEFQFPEVESNLLLNLGNTYMALKNYQEAYRHYRQREVFPVRLKNPATELAFRKNYGEACFKVGKSVEAITQYQKALGRVPDDQETLRAELLERIGLAQQDLTQYSEAVQSFSQAMEINLALGQTENLALLQRNIGVNLYNLSTIQESTSREALKKALQSYFVSLETLQQFGGKEQEKGEGLLKLDVALSEDGSQAATGFDRQGEEKLMFSYIAGTYEKLSEPALAREYYLKKLHLLTESSESDAADVARLSEKAIVLNRIGILSAKLGLEDDAQHYMRQSLGYTQTLGLRYGTGVNLFNLARLTSDRMLTGKLLDQSMVQVLVDGLDEQIAADQKDSQTFFALTNTAFLLHHLSLESFSDMGKLENHVAFHHALYSWKSRVWPYFSKASELIEEESVVLEGDVQGTQIALKLNMLEVAQEAGQEEKFEKLQSDLLYLVSDEMASNGWLWYLAEAERASTVESRQEWLDQAFQQLMAFPPQVFSQGTSSVLGASYDRLVHLSVVTALERDQPEQAWERANQIARRKWSTLLFDSVGGEFFLHGLGEYTTDLQQLLSEIQQARESKETEQLEELLPQLEEYYYVLFEETPWVVSSFWQYPLQNEILAQVLNSQRPYVQLIPGADQIHGFIHDGQQLQYVPLSSNGKQLQQALSEVSSVYLSYPKSLDPVVSQISSTLPPVVRVSTVYDVLDGYYLGSLFYSNVAVTGEFPLQTNLTSGEIPLSLKALTGDLEKNQAILNSMDVLVSTRGQEHFTLEITEELGVREFVDIVSLPKAKHHTAIIFKPDQRGDFEPSLLVYGLLRRGFPHVIVNSDKVAPEVAQKFISHYLGYLEDLPAAEAVAMANADVMDEKESRKPFVLFGYGGMDEEEKAEFAETIYANELDEAVRFYQEEAYPEALERIENALAVIHYADKTADFKDLTNLAVDAAFKVEDYEKAVFYQEKILTALEEELSPEERSEGFYRLGVLYSRLEQYDLAIQHLDQAIAQWEQVEELDRLAEGIATLGVVRENMGSYSAALGDFGRSFELYQEMGEIGDVATQYRRIGRIYYLRLGRYEQARANFLLALEALRELGDQRGEAETIFEIGLTYEKMGLFAEADEQYREGKQIGEDMEDAFVVATGNLYLANTAWFRGDYQQAFQSLSAAEKMAKQANDTQLSIMVKNTRGLMYWTLNDTDKGLTYLKQAVALSEQADIKTELASSLNNLGLIYRQREEYETSLEYFERAKSIDEDLNSRWGLGYDYRNIGMSLLKLGNLGEAESHFLKAEKVSAEIKNAINWVKALLELGNVNRDLRKPVPAKKYYEQAYAVATRYGIKEVEWRAAGGQAALLRDDAKLEEAFNWYAVAVEVVEGMRASLKIDELRNSFQTNKLDLYRETIEVLVRMGRTEEAFNYLERSRSRSFIDLLGNQKLTLHNPADQETLDRITDLSLRVAALKTELGSYDEPPLTLDEQYREAKALYEEALIELKQQNPSLSTFVSVDPLVQSDIEQMLDPGVGLISYMLGKEKSFMWLIQRSGTNFYEIPYGEQYITEIVTQYRSSVQHLEPVDEELKKLYEILITPVWPDLQTVEYLGLIPDGPLHFLSFAALKSPKGYLVEQFPIFYTPSASVLKFTFAKRKQEKQTKVLAVGNPDLGNYNYDLPLAELEAQSIRWNYPDMDILTGSQATKQWFVENISQYGIIHLAAHGEFDEFNPLLSSLWLASEQPENRRLTVKEVFGLEINADLVTLSACQTGLGKLEGGELIGLNRAFIYAGTHALVSALWRVDDLSTSVIMKHFYRNYVTLDKAKSLRQAQLIVKKDFPHPSYWAGFNLVGDYL
jgi:CHAT domain-containing protein